VRIILWGLYYVHEKGMVHCDLKPSNIFDAENSVANRRNVNLFPVSLFATECINLIFCVSFQVEFDAIKSVKFGF
jgi:serine/threonine protein kinase